MADKVFRSFNFGLRERRQNYVGIWSLFDESIEYNLTVLQMYTVLRWKPRDIYRVNLYQQMKINVYDKITYISKCKYRCIVNFVF